MIETIFAGAVTSLIATAGSALVSLISAFTKKSVSWSVLNAITGIGLRQVGVAAIVIIPLVAGAINIANDYFFDRDLGYQFRLGYEILIAYFASLLVTIGSIIVQVRTPATILIFKDRANYIERNTKLKISEFQAEHGDSFTHEGVEAYAASALSDEWCGFERLNNVSKIIAGGPIIFGFIMYGFIALYSAPLRVITAAMGA
jgi:hypothetical protein